VQSIRIENKENSFCGSLSFFGKRMLEISEERKPKRSKKIEANHHDKI